MLKKNNTILYLMLAPAVMYLIAFKVIPIFGMKLAFYDYSILGNDVFVGLKYFKELFSGPTFTNVLVNTVIISTLKMVIITPIPIMLTLVYNQLRSQGYLKFIQTVSYLPHLLSWVIIAGIFGSILSFDGLVNSLRGIIGLSPIDFLTSKEHIRSVLVASEMWRSVGWDTIIYMAAALKINISLYEAARIDGAGNLTQMIKITLPHLIPIVITMFILNIGFFLSAGVDQSMNFMNESVMSKIDIIDTYVYRVGILNAQYSLATAASLIKGVVGAILVLVSHFSLKKLTGKGVW